MSDLDDARSEIDELETQLAEARARVAEVEADVGSLQEAVEAQAESIRSYVAKVEALESQLAAATNDAARAELRARDFAEVAAELAANSMMDMDGAMTREEYEATLDRRAALAAAPDSDARLREVMASVEDKARKAGWLESVNKERREWADDAIPVKTPDEIINEVLGVKP